MKKKVLLIALFLVAIGFMGCVHTETVYVEKSVLPELVFPVFPVLEGAVRNEDKTVTVPEEWILRMAEYKIRIEETEKSYNDLKALYNSEFAREN